VVAEAQTPTATEREVTGTHRILSLATSWDLVADSQTMRFGNCFTCGTERDLKKSECCPVCSDKQVFNPKEHDPNYDFSKDPTELSKLRFAIALGTLICIIGYVSLR
jgi:hypothetical protein